MRNPKPETDAPHGAMAPAEAKERWFWAALLALAAFELWLLPAASSFWLDETGTFWVIKDGVRHLLARAMYWPAQSPVYYLTAWVAFAVGGSHELVLRAPSILAMAAAAWLLFKLAVRLFDPATAPLAVLVFVCSESVAFAASDARPYALGLCLFTGAVLMLIRWLDTGRMRYAAAHSLLSALAIATHCLLAVALIPLGLYAIRRVLGEGRVKMRTLAASWISAALLLAPLVSQWLRSYNSRGSHSFAGTPGFGDLLGSIAPPVLAGSIILGFLAAWLALPRLNHETTGDPRKGGGGFEKQAVLLTVCWAVLPPLVCYAVSVFTSAKLFVPRYYIASAPGLALVAGWLIRSNTAGSARRIVAVALAVGAILSFGTLHHGGDDWAGAMRAVRSTAGASDIPVLVASGFVEASDPKALEDPSLREMLFAPLAMYPSAGKLIRLPFRQDKESIPYMEGVIATALEHRSRFLFVGRWQGLSFEPWLRGRLADRGFQSESLGDFGNVGVFLFSAPEPR